LPQNPTQLNSQYSSHTTSQSKKIPGLHHSLAVLVHYLSVNSWYRALQLPQLLNYVERVCHLKDLQREKFDPKNQPNEEYLLWATSAPGLYMARKNYEVLETYGDTALKLAATMLAFWYKRNDRKAGEGDIENAKVCFITNFHLFRVGNHHMF